VVNSKNDAFLFQYAYQDYYAYKSCPSIYQSLPAKEDTHALIRSGIRLIRRDINVMLLTALYPDF